MGDCQEIPKQLITTSCRDCWAAEYAGNEQTGCYLGRIKKYEDRGVPVSGFDDGEKKYLSVGTFCPAVWRPKGDHGMTRDEIAVKIREHLRVKVAVIVHLYDRTTREELRTSLAALAASVVKPVRVVAVLNDSGVRWSQAVRELEKLPEGVRWTVVSLKDKDHGPYPTGSREHALDAAVAELDNREAAYYVALDAGFLLPVDYISRLDSLVNDELVPVAAVRPRPADGHNGYAAMVKLHRHPTLAGNVGLNIVDKFDMVREHYNKGWEVVDTLCPNTEN